MKEMLINANIKGALDFSTLDQALGIKDIEMKGLLNTNLIANGIFSLDKNYSRKQKVI